MLVCCCDFNIQNSEFSQPKKVSKIIDVTGVTLWAADR